IRRPATRGGDLYWIAAIFLNAPNLSILGKQEPIAIRGPSQMVDVGGINSLNQNLSIGAVRIHQPEAVGTSVSGRVVNGSNLGAIGGPSRPVVGVARAAG